MGVKIKRDVRSLANRLRTLVDDFTPEMKIAGEAAADEIVRTTLSNKADGDKPFAEYSKSYQELLDAVGGKPSGHVDLRGVFLPKGKRQRTPKGVSKNLLQKGGGRKAYIFITVAKGKKTILVQTRQTRARQGLEDKNSEMSRDLITVVAFPGIKAEHQRVKLIYRPRRKNYMIVHQRGEGKMPQRKWFSVNKIAVRTAAIATMKHLFAARVAEFNAGR